VSPAGALRSRRRFLAVAGGGALAVLVGCGSGPRGNVTSALPGLEHVDAVAEVGRRALADGVVADGAEALGILPVDGRRPGGDAGGLTLEDPQGFLAAVQRSIAAELDRGELDAVAGFLLTPTEAALAVAVHLSNR
jgi:hypothetical protein